MAHHIIAHNGRVQTSSQGVLQHYGQFNRVAGKVASARTLVQGIIACVFDKVIKQGERDVETAPLDWNIFSQGRLSGPFLYVFFILPKVTKLRVQKAPKSFHNMNDLVESLSIVKRAIPSLTQLLTECMDSASIHR
jgi:hypothetical protein